MKHKVAVGDVEITYKKKDGSIRVANGKIKSEYQRRVDTITYFDYDKDAFRSFGVENIIKLKSVKELA